MTKEIIKRNQKTKAKNKKPQNKYLAIIQYFIKYLRIAIPIVIVCFLSFFFDRYFLLIFIPFILFIWFIYRKEDILFTQFLITIFATGAGVFLANYTHKVDAQASELDFVINYLEVGRTDLIFKYDDINQTLANLEDSTSKVSEFFLNSEKSFPTTFMKIIKYEICIRNIYPAVMGNYLILNEELTKYYNNSQNRNIKSFDIRVLSLKQFRSTLTQMIDITDLQIAYLKGNIKEDILNKKLKELWNKYYPKDQNKQ